MTTIFKRYPQSCAFITTGMLVVAFVILLVREFLLHTLFQRSLENIANALFFLGIFLAYSCILATRSFLQNSKWYTSGVYWFLVVSPWIIMLSSWCGPFFMLQQFLVVALYIGALAFPFLVFQASRHACMLAVPFALLPVTMTVIIAIIVLHKFIEIWPEEPTYALWGMLCAVLVGGLILFYRQRIQSAWLTYFLAFIAFGIVVYMIPEVKRMAKPLFLERLHNYYASYEDARNAALEQNKLILLIYGTNSGPGLEKIAEDYLISQVFNKYQNAYIPLRIINIDDVSENVQEEIQGHMGFQQIALIDPQGERYISVITKWRLQSLKELLACDVIIYENCT